MRIGDPRQLIHELTAEPLAILESKADELRAALPRIADGSITDAEMEALAGGYKERFARRFAAALGQDGVAAGGGVALIPLFGMITQRSRFFGTSVERFMELVEAGAADDDIETIVIVSDTPGGSVSGVFEASERIYELRSKKRIILVSDPLCASAGYALGSSAHEVVVSKGSRTGSIGVISIFAEFSKALEDAGINVKVFRFGEHKGEGNPFEPLTDEASAHIQETVNDYGKLFLEAVSRNRGVTPEEVAERMGKGRAMTAERAVEAGLADRVATLDEVLADLGVRRRSPDSMQALEVVDVAARDPNPNPNPDAETEGDPMTIDQPRRTAEEPEAASDPNNEAVEQPEAAADATGANEPAEPTPEGEEDTMADKNANEPQENGAGTATVTTDQVRKQEATRARDIVTLAAAHGMADQASEWIEGGKSADWVGREILRLKAEEAKPDVTATQPSEERGAEAPAVIRRRFSSREDEPGFELGMRMLGLAAAAEARRDGRQVSPADFVAEGGFGEIAAAMRSDRTAAGGAMVAENYLANEFIELLRPASAVRQLNPRYLPLVGGNASIPKLTGGATASYKGEAQRGSKSEATTGRVNLVSKSLMAFVPITSQLLRRATPDAAATIRDDGLAATAQRSDLAFIRGDGTQDTPKGLRNLAGSDNVFAANSTVNLDNVTDDLGDLELKLEENDVRMIRPGLIFAPRTKKYLMTVRDGNGNYAFRDEILAGRLNGHPFAVTSQIPTNLGGGGDESEIYFADFADVVIGEEETVRIDVFDQANYWDGSQWVSTAQNDEVVLRIVVEHDIGLRHDESVAVLTGVTWGA